MKININFDLWEIKHIKDMLRIIEYHNRGLLDTKQELRNEELIEELEKILRIMKVEE